MVGKGLVVLFVIEIGKMGSIFSLAVYFVCITYSISVIYEKKGALATDLVFY